MSSVKDQSSSESLSTRIAEYEKKISDLTECNKVLTNALETSHRLIEHHEKIISNLQKKLELQKAQLFREKLHELGKCIRQLTSIRDDALVLLSDCDSDNIIALEPRNSRNLKICIPNNISSEKSETSLHMPDSTQHGATPVTVSKHRTSTPVDHDTTFNRSKNEQKVKASSSLERSSPSKSLSPNVKKKKLPEKKEAKKKNNKRILKIKIPQPLKRKPCSSSNSSSSSEKQTSHNESSMPLNNVKSLVKETRSYRDDDILAMPSTSKAKQFEPKFRIEKNLDSNKKKFKKSNKSSKGLQNSSDDIVEISDTPDSSPVKQTLLKNHSDVQDHKQQRRASNDKFAEYRKMIAKAKASKLPQVLLVDILKCKNFTSDPLISKYHQIQTTHTIETTSTVERTPTVEITSTVETAPLVETILTVETMSDIEAMSAVQLEETVEEEIPHLVPEPLIVEEPPDDVEIPLVSELETVPTALEACVTSVEVPPGAMFSICKNEDKMEASSCLERSSHNKFLISNVKKENEHLFKKKEVSKKNKRILKVKITRPVKCKPCPSSSSSSEMQTSHDESYMLLSNVKSSVKETHSYRDDNILAMPSTSKAKQFEPEFRIESLDSSKKKFKKSIESSKGLQSSSGDILEISDTRGSSPVKQTLLKNHSDVQDHKQQRRSNSDKFAEYRKMVAKAKTSKLPQVLLVDVIKYKNCSSDPLISQYRERETETIHTIEALPATEVTSTVHLQETVEEEIAHLVPKTVFTEKPSDDDVQILSVDELETVPVALEDTVLKCKNYSSDPLISKHQETEVIPTIESLPTTEVTSTVHLEETVEEEIVHLVPKTVFTEEPSDGDVEMLSVDKFETVPVALEDTVLKCKNYSSDHLILKHQESEITPTTESLPTTEVTSTVHLQETVEEEIARLVPETVFTEEPSDDDINVLLVNGLETVPVALDDIVTSVSVEEPPDPPNPSLQEITHSFDPLDFDPIIPNDRCDESFFRLLEEVNSLTEKLQPAS